MRLSLHKFPYVRTILLVKREQFLSRLRRYCRKNGLSFGVDEVKGKGSHIVIIVGDKQTVVKAGEITPRYATLVLKQLDLPSVALK